MDPKGTPSDLREGVRSAIASALERDAELRGGRTARLLVAAGGLGIFGALGMIRILTGHPYGHHPASHAVLFSAVWSGLLVVTLALAFLRVRTPSLPLARAACVGVLGLGIAGVCSALCPDQHFLVWWVSTSAGGAIRDVGGLPLSALCFGGVSTFAFGTVAAAIALGGRLRGSIRPLLPAGMLLLLLAPGVALQSFGSGLAVFGGWLLGTAAGAYGGVRLGIASRRRDGTAIGV
jgi:hypothetical protein